MNYQIELCDTIGYWDCSYNYIKGILKAYADKPINVKISSLGGDAFEGFKIMQAFRDHGKVTAYLSGFVASAATIIALGAEKVVVEKNTLYLMHNCSTWVEEWGMMNKEEIQETIKELRKMVKNNEKIDHMAASCYADRCKKKIEDMKDLMGKAEWMSADEILELGLADEIADHGVKAELSKHMMCMMRACDMPIPDVNLADDADDVRMESFLDKFVNRLAAVMNPNFKLPLVSEDDADSKKVFTMNKNFVSVMALLSVEGLEADENIIRLSEEQMNAIESKIAAAAECDAKLAEANKGLTELNAALDAAKAELAAAVEAKDAEIAALNASIAEKDEKIAALSAAPADQSKDIHNAAPAFDPAKLSEEDAAKMAAQFVRG